MTVKGVCPRKQLTCVAYQWRKGGRSLVAIRPHQALSSPVLTSSNSFVYWTKTRWLIESWPKNFQKCKLWLQLRGGGGGEKKKNKNQLGAETGPTKNRAKKRAEEGRLGGGGGGGGGEMKRKQNEVLGWRSCSRYDSQSLILSVGKCLFFFFLPTVLKFTF